METAVKVGLPDELYKHLNEYNEKITKELVETKEALTDRYKENIQNDSRAQEERFAPVFDRYEQIWGKIGGAIISGGVTTFFKAWDQYQDQAAYKALNRATKTNTPVVPVVNVTVDSKDNEVSEKADGLLNQLDKLIMGGLALLGVFGGTGILGQAAELLTYLPKLLKGKLFDIPFIKNVLTSFGKFVTKLTAPIKGILSHFPRLEAGIKAVTTYTSKVFGKLGTMVSKVVGIVKNLGNIIAKPLGIIAKIFPKAGSIGTILSKGMSSVGKLLNFGFLRRLPLIGLALSLYQAYLRFQKGEIFDGILEIAIGVVGQFGPAGAAIAIGVELLRSFMENGAGGAGIITGTIKTVAKFSNGAGKLLATIGASVAKILPNALKWLAKVPVLGSVVSFGFAVYDFINGNATSGVLNVLSGLSNLLNLVAPGLGTGLSIAIDMLNMWLSSEADKAAGGKELSGKERSALMLGRLGKVFSNVWDWIVDLCDKLWDWICTPFEWIWEQITSFGDWTADIASKIWETIENFFDDIGKWLTNAYNGVVDEITSWFSDDEKPNAKKPTPPKRVKAVQKMAPSSAPVQQMAAPTPSVTPKAATMAQKPNNAAAVSVADVINPATAESIANSVQIINNTLYHPAAITNNGQEKPLNINLDDTVRNMKMDDTNKLLRQILVAISNSNASNNFVNIMPINRGTTSVTPMTDPRLNYV